MDKGKVMKNISELFSNSQVTDKRYQVLLPKSNKATYLTNKEAIVVKHLIEGKRLKQIAGTEETSIHTVNTHMANIKDKLGCQNTFQLGKMLGWFQANWEQNCQI